jgi:Xaa-Pro aminopeptidase
MGRYPEFDQRLLKWVNDVRSKSRAGVSAPAEFVELSHLLHELRLVKKPEEIKRMRRAARIAALAHIRAMRACLPGMTEYQIQAELEYEFLRGGAEAPAYESIVAGGANACVLHYVDNRMELKDGELLLIDAGCEVDCYASDITRTFPVNGRFSGEQRAVYEVVLASQKAAIDVVKAGAHWNEPHEAAVAVLTDGLRELGILKGDTDGLIEKEAYKDYYWHRTGHWLGMDVHDVGDYKVDGEWRVLEPGMVLTVEPGLYITEGSKADERWWNIGIRIEDDALVTTGAADILSSDAPKAPVDVEALVGSGVQ